MEKPMNNPEENQNSLLFLTEDSSENEMQDAETNLLEDKEDDIYDNYDAYDAEED